MTTSSRSPLTSGGLPTGTRNPPRGPEGEGRSCEFGSGGGACHARSPLRKHDPMDRCSSPPVALLAIEIETWLEPRLRRARRRRRRRDGLVLGAAGAPCRRENAPTRRAAALVRLRSRCHRRSRRWSSRRRHVGQVARSCSRPVRALRRFDRLGSRSSTSRRNCLRTGVRPALGAAVLQLRLGGSPPRAERRRLPRSMSRDFSRPSRAAARSGSRHVRALRRSDRPGARFRTSRRIRCRIGFGPELDVGAPR